MHTCLAAQPAQLELGHLANERSSGPAAHSLKGSFAGNQKRRGVDSPQEQSRGVNAVDWNRVEGNWKQVKGRVQEQWGELTDDDLDVIQGDRERLEGKIQERYGVERDRARQDVDDWYTRQAW